MNKEKHVKHKISVIVPVYQAETYMNRCIDSILNQSFKDFELILVDDGSKDNSGKICDEYSESDGRVRVIHQNNSGVSVARQVGLNEATGEYVIHADPDDWVEKDWLEELFFEAEKSEADITICDFFEESSGTSTYSVQKPSQNDSGTVLRELFINLHGSCCNKLVRKKCFDQYNIKFPEGIIFCEDLYVICKLLSNGASVSYVNKALYHYDCSTNKNSLAYCYSKSAYESDIKLFKLFSESLNEREKPDTMEPFLAKTITGRAFHAECFSNKEFKEKFSMFAPYLLKLEDKPRMIMLVLSTIGFYKPMLFMYKVIKKK